MVNGVREGPATKYCTPRHLDDETAVARQRHEAGSFCILVEGPVDTAGLGVVGSPLSTPPYSGWGLQTLIDGRERSTPLEVKRAW